MDLKARFLYPMGDGLGAKAAFSGSLVDGYTLLPVHVWVGWVMLGYIGLRWVMLGYADGTLNLSLIVRT